uniref:Uncharacterized protein n=1 Tax=Acrobeloides nanus TaxID=290746 RepID=A0A914CH52_9BILA
MKYLLVFLVFLPFLINAGVIFKEWDALEEEAGILRQKRACVFMRNGKQSCGESGTSVYVPGTIGGDVYDYSRTKRSTIMADAIHGDVYQRCNGDFSKCIVIEGGARKKRAWHCVGNCGSIQHIGTAMVRSGGDDSCVCMDV